ncbi:translation initiation factor IF-2-like [Eriocheir sinensis]|uniref:translation initiation factor IF-2-like n=1 Tax=Eriocheir sinensis TaxID=95602 RepID=UPI0021C87181|nr:translation initiation factor IF-2-like [Eriocheir sinensis]
MGSSLDIYPSGAKYGSRIYLPKKGERRGGTPRQPGSPSGGKTRLLPATSQALQDRRVALHAYRLYSLQASSTPAATLQASSLQASSTPATSNSTGVQPTSLEHTSYKQLYRRPAYKPRAHQLQATLQASSLQASSTPATSNSTGVKPTSLEHTSYKQLYRRPAYKPRAHQLQATLQASSLQASSTPASSNSTGVKPTSPEHTHRPTQPKARATIYKPLPRFKPALLRTLQATPRSGRSIHTSNEEARPADLGTPHMPLAPQLGAPPPLPGASAQTSSGKQSARVPAAISR